MLFLKIITHSRTIRADLADSAQSGSGRLSKGPGSAREERPPSTTAWGTACSQEGGSPRKRAQGVLGGRGEGARRERKGLLLLAVRPQPVPLRLPALTSPPWPQGEEVAAARGLRGSAAAGGGALRRPRRLPGRRPFPSSSEEL